MQPYFKTKINMQYIRPNDPPGVVHEVNDRIGEAILAHNKGFTKVEPLEQPKPEVPKTEFMQPSEGSRRKN